MVHEDKLSAVLSEFARTLVTDFPIQGILDHLVERIVEVLPVTAAGVTLISAGMAPRYIAASDESALRFERLQTELGQGPCLAAYESGEAVAVPDLRTDDRFPQFGPRGRRRRDSPRCSPSRCATATAGSARWTSTATPRATSIPTTWASRRRWPTSPRRTCSTPRPARRRATASDRFHHIALHDPLTGLPNRLLLQQRLEHAAQRASARTRNAAVLFADLDRFKQVNDTYGHQVGDELLLAVAQRLAGLVRPGDTLARVSGDEFVFLCEDLHSAADVGDPRPAHRRGVRRPVRPRRHRAHDHRQRRHGVRRPRRGDLRRARGQGRHRDVPGQAQGRRRPPDHRPARGAAERRLQQPRAGPAVGLRRRRARRRLPAHRAQRRRARHRRRGAAALDASRSGARCRRMSMVAGRRAERADQRDRCVGARAQLSRPRPLARATTPARRWTSR